jgi:hypothetical protein
MTNYNYKNHEDILNLSLVRSGIFNGSVLGFATPGTGDYGQ